MTHRRTAIPLLLVVGLLAFTVRASGAPAPSGKDRVPHLEAISLVLAKQRAAVEMVERSEERWTDTKERRWKVFRMYEPGLLDSTELIRVQFFIDNTLRCDWLVDLRKRDVSGGCGADIPIVK